MSLSWILWKSVNVVFSLFKDSLLGRNHLEIFWSSKFVFKKESFYHCSNKISLCHLQAWLTLRYLIPSKNRLYKSWRVEVLKLTLLVHRILSLTVLFFHYRHWFQNNVLLLASYITFNQDSFSILFHNVEPFWIEFYDPQYQKLSKNLWKYLGNMIYH